MKTVIIEDEPQVVETLKLLLAKYCPEIVITGVASSFKEGYDLCLSLQPELVLCDIRLNAAEGTGLDLVQVLNDRDMKVVFITGSKEFAVDAFRVHAIDYLLKPINIKELKEAVSKALAYKTSAGVVEKQAVDSLHIPTQHGFLVVPVRDIIRCEARSAYTHFHIAHKPGRQTASVNLGIIAEKLPAGQFFRVHKTHVINKAHIVEYKRGDGGMVRMSDNCEVPVSRLAKDAFMQWLL